MRTRSMRTEVAPRVLRCMRGILNNNDSEYGCPVTRRGREGERGKRVGGERIAWREYAPDTTNCEVSLTERQLW